MALRADERKVLVRYIGFRVWTAASCMLAVVVLVAPAWATWFSDNAGAGSAPANGTTDHWSLWAIIAGSRGSSGGLPIGGQENQLGWLLLLILVFTVLSLLRTAARGGWVPAMLAGSGCIAASAVEIALRVAGNTDHQGHPGPHSYVTGPGLALAQWSALAIMVWAFCMMSDARRWRRTYTGEPEPLAAVSAEQARKEAEQAQEAELATAQAQQAPPEAGPAPEEAVS